MSFMKQMQCDISHTPVREHTRMREHTREHANTHARARMQK